MFLSLERDQGMSVSSFFGIDGDGSTGQVTGIRP